VKFIARYLQDEERYDARRSRGTAATKQAALLRGR
jgi:hypothetical protein